MTPETWWERISSPIRRAYWWAYARVTGSLPCCGWCRPRRHLDPSRIFCDECERLASEEGSDG